MSRFNTLLVSAIVGIFCCPVLAQPRHLFLDPAFIEQPKNVFLVSNPADVRELVINHDKPWEKLMITFYTTVREEQGKLRMWYTCRESMARGSVAYAESTDGITWAKPNLGIVDFNGSKDNNLVNLRSLEGAVFQDPNAPPDQRYAYMTHAFGRGYLRYHSPDGLHWTADKNVLMGLGADSQLVCFYDETLKCYVHYLRGWRRQADSPKLKFRTVVRMTTPDLVTPVHIGPNEKSMYLWGKDKAPVIGDELPTVLAADDRDPPNTDVYTSSVQPYPLDPRWYVAFPSFFYRERGASEGKLEAQFAGSRDGITWHRYDRKPYMPLGVHGSDRQNMTFIGTGLVVRGDEIWQYGTGFHSKHGDVKAREIRQDGVIYRCVQRVDGFVSVDFGNDVGSFVTKPVKIDNPRLLVNVDPGALGHLQVALLDAAGNPIPGYSFDDCTPIRTNFSRVTVAWKGGIDLSALKGQDVRIAFTGRRAKLYSFYFTPLPNQ